MNALRRIWKGMRAVLMAIGGVLGRVNNFLLLSIAFYALLFPVAWVRRTFSRREDPPGWLPRRPLKREHFEKQY
ncbi:MAG TPA: hypothetical protein VLU25_04305 [Acidobacteriota bacterium]|nr:hypothetical protein [Acidobacteriota bacterium]